jgi:hypothetical protein
MAYGTRLLRLDEHRDALAALWRENMSDTRIGDVVPERIRWLYERNPAGTAVTWLGIVSGSDDVIGCASSFPRRMQVGGKMVSAGVLADFAVSKNHRMAGAAIAIQRALAKGSFPAGLEFLYGYPNGKSDAIFKRLGYHYVGSSAFWVKPLRSAYKVSERVKNRALAWGASRVLDVGLSIADQSLAFAHRGVRRVRGDRRRYRVEEVSRADERFDRLWNRARGEFVIVGEKSSSYLNWRYTDFTTRAHRFFCLVDRKSNELSGFVVYAVHDQKAVVADLFCERRDVLAKELLLRLAIRLRRTHVSSLVISYLGPDSFGEQLKMAGFLPRPGERSMIAYVDADGPQELRSTVFDKNAWFMIDGELDI